MGNPGLMEFTLQFGKEVETLSGLVDLIERDEELNRLNAERSSILSEE